MPYVSLTRTVSGGAANVKQEREVPPRLAGGFLPPLTIPDTSRDIYSTGGPRSPFHNAPPGPNMYNEPPYTISSNPPNPKTSFRAGDWM